MINDNTRKNVVHPVNAPQIQRLVERIRGIGWLPCWRFPWRSWQYRRYPPARIIYTR
jgi:hypothetical protein